MWLQLSEIVLASKHVLSETSETASLRVLRPVEGQAGKLPAE